MAKNGGIELEQVMEKEECIAYLEELIKCLRADKLVIEQGSNVVSFTPPNNIDLEVSAKKKEKKEKFSLQLSWTQEFKEEAGVPIKISQQEPETEEEQTQTSEEKEGSTFKL